MPGLGDLYAGFARRAAALLVFLPVLDVVFASLLLAIPMRGVNVAVPAALFLAVRLGLTIAAARRTSRLDPAMEVRWYSRWYSCLLAAVLSSVVIQPAWARLMRGSLVHAFRVPAGSMEDTILRGDYVLADMRSFGWRLPGSTVIGARAAERGQLVVFRYPEDPSLDMLKRVIGLPGEMVEVRGEQVLIDGQPLAESYARFGKEHDDLSRSWGPEKVPADQYFVLGDNRDSSKDSRYWGFIPQADLKGRVRIVYWSRDARTRRVRWERIGHRLD